MPRGRGCAHRGQYMSKLIAIDGLDGSGKGTQTAILCDWLRERGFRVKELSFPCYGTKGAVPVEAYLHGELGSDPEDTSAYAASTFFAVDRYVSYRTDWISDVKDENTVIVCNRYTTANAVHQLSKLPKDMWEPFLAWLWDFEFEKLGLPKPDLVLYLALPPKLSMQLVDHRAKETGAVKDIHELSKDHLEKSYEAAMYAADRLGWKTVRCHREDEIRAIDDIASEIRTLVAPVLKL